MTVWLKILLILILGGILSTLGDRLGSKVGKARLSIFKLRPKSTAVLITVFTGSIISAISFATMIVFDRDLRVGLFQLEDIREKIIDSEKELKKLEKNLYAFRSGNVVISSGQTLVTKVWPLLITTFPLLKAYKFFFNFFNSFSLSIIFSRISSN